MILKSDTIKKLKSAFDLNEYEVKTWVSLLSRGAATAGELSDTSGVPRSRAYDVLEGLEKKGFVIMKIGRPIRYIAIPPVEVINRVKRDIEAKSEEAKESIEKVRGSDSFNELVTLHSTGINSVDPSEISGSFKGRSNIFGHINYLLSNAKKEVIISATDEDMLKQVKHFRNLLAKLKQRGVKIKIFAPLQTKEAEGFADEAKNFANVKKTELLNRFIIVDGDDLMIMTNNNTEVNHTNDIALWVKTPFFANSLKTMIDAFHNKD